MIERNVLLGEKESVGIPALSFFSEIKQNLIYLSSNDY
jgi:hypothetical protein